MHPHAHGNTTHTCATSQGYAATSTYGTAFGYGPNPNTFYAPAPGYVVPQTPTPPPAPPVLTSSPPLTTVQVPTGCYPIELVQFWRRECVPPSSSLHWALFVRTAPPRTTRSTSSSSSTVVGHFYELVGTPETYTAQFLPDVTVEPCALVDWRGTHVVGWVSAGQLGAFERVVRQVPVWRCRAGWRCRQWVYDVMQAVGESGCPGMFIMTDGLTFGRLERRMGRLLEAWESGDI